MDAHERPVCPICHKVSFEGPIALRIAETRRRLRTPPRDKFMEAYRARCGNWHLGHSSAGLRANRRSYG